MKTIIALITIIGAAFTSFFFLDTRFAKCADVKAIEKRLDYKIQNDRLLGMQQRAWQLEEKYPDASKAPAETQRQMKEIGVGLQMQREKVMKMEGGAD